jgi:chemotaxis protein histidine kinase CheA
MIGFVRLAHACHVLESEIHDTSAALPVARFDGLATLFAESRKRVEALAGPAQDLVQVSPAEFDWLLATLRALDPAAALRASSWRLARVERLLDQLGSHSRRIAERLGKQVDVVVDCPDLRVDRAHFEGVWSALVHAIRNAVDHGIETPAEREAVGKRRQGQIKLVGRVESGLLRIAIEDDGRGIDLERLRSTVADQHGGAARSWPLLELVCARGVSTALEVSETSGRGVGVGALRDVVVEHGGTMSIKTEPSAGTRLGIDLPLGGSSWWHDQEAA